MLAVNHINYIKLREIKPGEKGWLINDYEQDLGWFNASSVSFDCLMPLVIISISFSDLHKTYMGFTPNAFLVSFTFKDNYKVWNFSFLLWS